MKRQRVAVIGAGPSGLAAAKAILECGMVPTVFEAAETLGGLWRADGGFVWKDMRTNISKWNCAFSDFPWPESAPEFPLRADMLDYMSQYAREFSVDDHIEYGSRAVSIEPKGSGWIVVVNGKRRQFRGVVVGSGVFSLPSIPNIGGIKTFRGKVIHSAEYPRLERCESPIVIIGASFTGIEIAAHLADQQIESTLVFERPVWILPRCGSIKGCASAPLDLLLSHHHQDQEEGIFQDDLNRRKAQFFNDTFGNPGDIHPDLMAPVDGSPPYVVVSDTFLHHVQSGLIRIARGHLAAIDGSELTTTRGTRLRASQLIFCTGYETNFSFVRQDIRKRIEYVQSDRLVPFIANKAVVGSGTPPLFFVGLYRGPYFGVIELQARWAAMLLAGLVQAPDSASMREQLQKERDVRGLRPRPQFPHADYVAFADAIAGEIGVMPDREASDDLRTALSTGPVTPAQYRLSGPFAAPDRARAAMLSACRRVGF